MNSTRKTQKLWGENKRGGNKLSTEHESILRYYAQQIKNKIFIDIPTMEKELNKIESPLKHAIVFDSDTTEKYTLNEYALINEGSFLIHNVFSYYEVDLSRKVKYPNEHVFSETPYNILEAYILYSIYESAIDSILKQIIKSKNYDLLFEYDDHDTYIPTILKYAALTSLFKESNRYIFHTILFIYRSNDIFPILTNNYDDVYLLQLVIFGIRINHHELVYFIITKVKDPNLLLNYIFNEDVINVMLIHNNEEIYKILITILNIYPDNIISNFVCWLMQPKRKCTAKSIDKFMGLYRNKKYRPFFEYLGKYAIKNLLIPSIYNFPKIIIIGHGVSLGTEEKKYAFPFSRCCFFTEKGKILEESKVINKNIEELICTGHYDLTLECIESSNGKIHMEDMRFSFMPKNNILHGKNSTLGFYLCNNTNLQKIFILGIGQTSAIYTFNEIVAICDDISNSYGLPKHTTEIMAFSCRGYTGETCSQSIFPQAIIDDKITPDRI